MAESPGLTYQSPVQGDAGVSALHSGVVGDVGAAGVSSAFHLRFSCSGAAK
jgi:hypothetical protein